MNVCAHGEYWCALRSKSLAFLTSSRCENLALALKIEFAPARLSPLAGAKQNRSFPAWQQTLLPRIMPWQAGNSSDTQRQRIVT
jgi:hypothetical protein